MMSFSDRLAGSAKKRASCLIAGLDPVLEMLPVHFLDAASKASRNNEEATYAALDGFYRFALGVLATEIAAVKPNSAFFEQYGVAGMRALRSVCAHARELDLPVIMDAKRGDIGSTAQAYSNAFLGEARAHAQPVHAFSADAVTVNPFLGFETLEPFIEECRARGKGIFVLVKTSNPGSADLQDQKLADGTTISEKIARWLDSQAGRLAGSCGFSGLGAVVGATQPAAARALRNLMPSNFFLIPGFGSQGGSAADAVAGFGKDGGGAVVNASRALLGSFSRRDLAPEELGVELRSKARSMNASLNGALSGKG